VPPLPDGGEYTGDGRALRGCLLGLILAVALWFVPIPVALVVRVLGFHGPFVDAMLMAIPFYLAIPLIGAAIGSRWGRRRG